MSTNYKDLCTEIKSTLNKFRHEMPSTMEHFGNLTLAAGKNGAISEKYKELIALAIGIAQQCDSCIGMHMEKLIKLNVTREEILETLSVNIFMGGGPALMYAVKAMQAYEELSK